MRVGDKTGLTLAYGNHSEGALREAGRPISLDVETPIQRPDAVFQRSFSSTFLCAYDICRLARDAQCVELRLDRGGDSR
jgi:hypothetical protein